jgi:hypothetical protein
MLPGCVVTLGQKKGGETPGFTCNVTHKEETTTYFGKLQQGTTGSTSSSGCLKKSEMAPNIKEMVVYKFLEMAEIGKDLTD